MPASAWRATDPSLIGGEVRESARRALGANRLAKREPAGGKVPTKRDLVIELAVMVAIGVALAALGPFGSFAMGPFAERLAYWLPVSLFGYAVFRPILALARAQAERLDLPAWAGVIGGVALAAAPVTLIVLWWNGNGFGALPRFADWFQLYLQVALIGAIITLTFLAIERPAPPAGAHHAPEGQAVQPPSPPEPPFLDRLPAAWNRELTALEMEDHYVRAHNGEASTLILMRLRDAEAELGGVEGLRVHRSWWVARSAVERVVRDGRKVELQLRGGLTAPVARDRLPALRAAGWLD